MSDLSVLVEAKKEYTAQLAACMSDPMIEVFHRMYQEAVKNSKGKKVLVAFQALLRDTPNWSNSMVKGHTDVIVSSCSYFSDLLAAVFVASTKIMSSVRLRQDTRKISLKMPSNETFTHTVYINAAKEIYSDPYVFGDDVSEQKRDADLRVRFAKVIEDSVKELIPIKEILSTYMAPAPEDDAESKDIDLSEDVVEGGEDPDIVSDDDNDDEEEEDEREYEEEEEYREEEPEEVRTMPVQAPVETPATTPATPAAPTAPVINEFGAVPPPRPPTPGPQATVEQQPATFFSNAPDARVRRR